MCKVRKLPTCSLLAAFAPLLILAISLTSCGFTNQSIKIKNNAGNIYLNRRDTTVYVNPNTILNNPVTLQSLLNGNYRDNSASFHIYLVDNKDSTVIEASSAGKGGDSLSLQIRYIDKSRNTRDTFQISYSRMDLNTHQLIFKNNSEFEISFLTDTATDRRRLFFSVSRFAAFSYNNSQFQLLTGELSNQQNVYNFFIINDPEPETTVLATACILSFVKSWENKCRELAKYRSQNQRKDCIYQIKYKNFKWHLFEKEVHCEISCL